MKPDGSMRVRPHFYPEMEEKEMSLKEFKVRLFRLSKKKSWHATFIKRDRDGIYTMLITNGEHNPYTPGWQMCTREEYDTFTRETYWKMFTSGHMTPRAWRETKKPQRKRVTLDDWL